LDSFIRDIFTTIEKLILCLGSLWSPVNIHNLIARLYVYGYNSLMSNSPVKFVASGFPSPGDDFAKPSLDLNSYLIDHPSASFFMTIEGNAYSEFEIYNGDILLVDRARKPKAKDLVVAISEELEIKTIEEVLKNKQELWGVITTVIRKL